MMDVSKLTLLVCSHACHMLRYSMLSWHFWADSTSPQNWCPHSAYFLRNYHKTWCYNQGIYWILTDYLVYPWFITSHIFFVLQEEFIFVSILSSMYFSSTSSVVKELWQYSSLHGSQIRWAGTRNWYHYSKSAFLELCNFHCHRKEVKRSSRAFMYSCCAFLCTNRSNAIKCYFM